MTKSSTIWDQGLPGTGSGWSSPDGVALMGMAGKITGMDPMECLGADCFGDKLTIWRASTWVWLILKGLLNIGLNLPSNGSHCHCEVGRMVSGEIIVSRGLNCREKVSGLILWEPGRLIKVKEELPVRLPRIEAFG